jgi:flagellar biosynthetic protein FliQ
MGASDIHKMITDTLLAILFSSGPVLLIAMAVGFGVALFQALTSVQEMTLTFVPKVIAIFIGIALTLPFIFITLSKLADQVFDLILSGGL